MTNHVKTRDSALSAIKRYMTKSTDTAFVVDLENIASYLQLLDEQWTRFLLAQDSIESSCGSELFDVQANTREQAETYYTTALSNFNRQKNVLTRPVLGGEAAPKVSASIRLPKMELPNFSGESTEWISFHDAFQSLVHANNNLTDGQKLHYLRSCLKGEALKVISSFKICDANYEEAWELLRSRYKVMRVIVDGHFRALSAIYKTNNDSADSIKQILDTTLQHTRALKALGRPVDFWDDWLVYVVVEKLAFETRKQWELSLLSDDPPTFDQLTIFLETRCRSLAMLSSPTTDAARNKYSAKGVPRNSVNAFHVVEERKSTSPCCAHCSGNHKIYDCAQFSGLSVSARKQFIMEKGACLNCLSTGHYSSKCRSFSSCRICRRRHHTLIHTAIDDTADAATVSITPHDQESAESLIALPGNPVIANTAQNTALTTTTETTTRYGVQNAVLLATALVKVQDYSGRWQTARILFDTGSHASFVTDCCVQRLRLSRKSSDVVVTGIGSAIGGLSKGETMLSLSPRLSNQSFKINALILSKITNDLPTSNISVASWTHLIGLPLADPRFMRPGPIDILIGMDQMSQFITTEIRKGDPGTPMAQSTVFGWMLFGCVSDDKPAITYTQNLHCDTRLVRVLGKLWELEEAPLKKYYTAEEKFCEDHFESTVQRAADGRYIVELPLNRSVTLGESRNFAIRSLIRMERRFVADESLRLQYNNFMSELIQMNHMELVHDMPANCYYMPHHSVLKETSATTKLRVVFNASAKTSSGYSLNDALMIGPQLQEDLFSILLRFRTHRFGLCADIAKMYRQVYVSEKHINLQRIVWRPHPSLPIQDYRMLRVTYGVAAASHLAVRALQQTAKDAYEEHKHAADIILRDFYMDDLLTGCSTINELQMLQQTISTIVRKGGFELRQWASNCEEITSCKQQSLKEIAHYFAEGKEAHALGLIWNTEEDCLKFTVNLSEPPNVLSKRAFLSDASTLFDPLGLLSPSTIRSKMWFQEIWRTKIDWDDVVPDQIATEWAHHRRGLKLFAELNIDRWLGIGTKGSYTELHTFADASERAYAAVMYARTVQADGTITVVLVTSKTKVAPLKVTTLPRLELCAAHLAARLVRNVTSSWHNMNYPLYAWSDSTITLAWLQAHPSRWVTFIANRVADTQEVLPAECWHHVRSEHNPADCASRGITPKELLHHQLWWNGPPFLKTSGEFWKHIAPPQHTTDLEARSSKLAVHVANSAEYWPLITKYSSYTKLKRVAAYALRFIANIRAKTNHACQRKSGPLTCKEIHDAEFALIKYTQKFYFSNEISHCSLKKPIPLRSSLLRLQPFLDDLQVLRVGGRLTHATATNDVKHPIILAKNSPLAKLIVAEIHTHTLHAGPQIMHTVLQRRFWVISARNLIRQVYHKCVKCTRLNRNVAGQSMADLPRCRTTYTRCFLRSSVDFAGPYSLKFSHGRGARACKGYICSFICMSTGAMHLELVGDLTSASFLNAFKRFISRRGYCSTMFSDNGTNFVGAEKELQKMFQRCMADVKLQSFFADSSITWHFNPPSAPHMGGYWEIGIKRVKYHLKRVLGEVLLTYEELSTLLTEVEACVNSRPLCIHATDANDLEILTPGHFIVGEPLKALPEPEIQEFNGNLHQRWHAISSMRQHFWKRWRGEYLVSLQRRTKWFRPTLNLEENDVVAVMNEATPPTKWKLARVVKCHPGHDGRVRVVTILTSDGELVRPIVKLCLIPTKSDIFS